MTVYRLPVLPHPDATTEAERQHQIEPRPPLDCVDLRPGASGERVCAEAFARFKIGEGQHFGCPNLNKGCVKGAYLYPRFRRSATSWHYHQGIDIGRKTGQPIVAVIAGEVVRVVTEDSPKSYGRVVVIKGKHRSKDIWTLYGHCDEVHVKLKDRVVERQVIATVGHSGSAGSLHPHLHFECSYERLPLSLGDETVLGQTEGRFPRIDPNRILEELGPWGSTDVYFPDGVRPTQPRTRDLHAEIENATGGYFPVGSNSNWHGGVHLRSSYGKKLVAPFDGEIVALRLDPNPVTALGAFGHTNFILLRHEISDEAFRRLQWRPIIPPTPEDAADEAEAHQRDGKFAQVGYPLAESASPPSSNPDDIAWVQRRLVRFREYELAHPEIAGAGGAATISAVTVDSTYTPELRAAIRAFQLAHVKYFKHHPKDAEGYVTPGGQTRIALEKTCGELFAGKKKKPKGTPAPKPETPSVGREATNHPDDVTTAKHALREATGGPFYVPVDPAALDEPTADAEFIAAIEAFQATMGYPYKKAGKLWPDGVMTVGAKTWTALFAAQPEPPPPDPATDDPAKDDPSKDGPATPDPTELDPKRTIYSLFMHLAPRQLDARAKTDFPWVGEVALTPTPDEERDVAVQRLRKIEGDAEERARGILADVGAPGVPSDPADVTWVQQRLTRFDYYQGEIDGIYDDTLKSAVAAFQRAHVKYYDPKAKKPNEPPGYVKVGTISKSKKIKNGDTHKRLRDPYDALFSDAKPPVDPVFAARAAALDGKAAKVITMPGVTIDAGQPLWASGLAAMRGPTGLVELHEQVHWELFSEHPMVEPWEQLEDLDDDLTFDAPAKVFDRIEYDGPPGFARDRMLLPEEVREFFASGKAEFFRRAQCRFRSEWGLDVAATVARLRTQGFTTDGYAEQIAPYVWWDAAKAGAGDAMPAGKHVWHYNPIEFLWRYEQVLASMRPGDDPTPKAPTMPSSLEARVTYADLTPMSQALVHLIHGGFVLGSAWTDLEGVALFGGLPPGESMVWIDGTQVTDAVTLAEGGHGVAHLRAEVAGPGLSVGTVEITVLAADHLPLPDAEVWLTHAGDNGISAVTNAAGVASFAVAQGYYVATTAAAEAASITVVGGALAEATLEIVAVGTVAVGVRSTGAVAMSGEAVLLIESGGPTWGREVTDADGQCSFEQVPEGAYDIALERDMSVTQALIVGRDAVNSCSLLVPVADTPNVDASRGAIDVLVVGPHDVPSQGDTVYLLDDFGDRLDDVTADSDGRASFEDLEPGIYGISSDLAVRDEFGIAIDAGVRKSLVLEVGPRDAPKPTPEVGRGAVMVTAWWVPSGAAAKDRWAKLARYGEVVRMLMLDGEGAAAFDDVEVGPYRAFVEGHEAEGVELEVVEGQSVPLLLPIAGAP
jgi:peptidoglycan hydrolase-like protein with peptidoglycan-binding domain